MTATPIPASGCVDTLQNYHPEIRSEDWRSPLIRRLLGTSSYADGNKVLSESFHGNGSVPQAYQLTLTWQGHKQDFDRCVKTYQSPIITEYATLGLACLLLGLRTNHKISEVTLRGDRADYWLDGKSLLLEVSGQQDGSMHQLVATKEAQLRANPFGKPGYVCAATYASSEAVLKYTV